MFIRKLSTMSTNRRSASVSNHLTSSPRVVDTRAIRAFSQADDRHAGTLSKNTDRTIRRVKTGKSLTVLSNPAVRMDGGHLFETLSNMGNNIGYDVCPVLGGYGTGIVRVTKRQMESNSRLYILQMGTRKVTEPMDYYDQAHQVRGELPQDSEIFIDTPITMDTEALNSFGDIQMNVQIPGDTGRKSVWLSAVKLLRDSKLEPPIEQSSSASLSGQLEATNIGGTNYVFY
eukprot:102345_1